MSDTCACGHERDEHDDFGECDVELDEDFVCPCSLFDEDGEE